VKNALMKALSSMGRRASEDEDEPKTFVHHLTGLN
jgi:hypothetical protein